MNRIFIEPPSSDSVRITGEDAKHLQVLRVNVGDTLPLSDGKGMLYTGKVERVTPQAYELSLSDARASREGLAEVTLFQALCKGDKTEQIVQKSVELGVTEIVLFVSDTCVAKPDGKEDAKIERFARVARLAAMQSGREIVPVVRGFLTFDEVVKRCQNTSTLFFYEKAEKKLSEAIRALPSGKISLIVGCEGGFLPREVKKLTDAGIEPLSLGKRILRAETAPVVALSVLMAHLGEI